MCASNCFIHENKIAQKTQTSQSYFRFIVTVHKCNSLSLFFFSSLGWNLSSAMWYDNFVTIGSQQVFSGAILFSVSQLHKHGHYFSCSAEFWCKWFILQRWFLANVRDVKANLCALIINAQTNNSDVIVPYCQYLHSTKWSLYLQDPAEINPPMEISCWHTAV